MIKSLRKYDYTNIFDFLLTIYKFFYGYLLKHKVLNKIRKLKQQN